MIAIIAAAVATWIFGAIWYSIFAQPWIADSGVPLAEDGKPANRTSPVPYVISVVALFVVAAMMQYGFSMLGVQSFQKGFLGGLGVGLFFITPWILINNGYAGRPFGLTLIDGGYASVGCAVIGLVLVLI